MKNLFRKCITPSSYKHKYNLPIHTAFFNLFIFLLSVLNISCTPVKSRQIEAHQSKNGKPSLILFVVVDQFPWEYIDRFGPLWSGGLKRLVSKGLVYSNAFHSHAITETCPGHATLMTGSHPNQHGIVSNYWPNRETGSLQYCVQDNNGNFTPENLVRPTLGDLLKDHDHQSKVYSISAKDRAAIIMAGKKGDAAYWYDKENGTFQSSDYYDNSAPQWLKEFNSLKLLDSFFSQSWTPLPVDSNSLRLAKIRTLDQGVFKKQLPLPVGGITLKPDSVFYTDIMNTPFIDEYTGLMAEEVLKKEQLGLDDHTDILAVSFSATDLIGHEYGPNSVEILDNILRLDATIEHLLSNVEKLVGLEKVLVVFSSDHGVQAMPELKGDSDKHHRRISTSNIQCIQGALNNEPDIKNMVTSYFTVTDLKALPVIKSAIKKCPYIDNVWTVLDINTPSKNPYQQLYANSYFKGRSPDLFIQWRENFLPMFHKETNHGTPYPYDAHVPVIFYGANIEPKKIDQPFDTTMIVQHTINHLK